MTIASVIYGLAGTKLSPDEKAFFRDIDPWGFILFARNIEGINQVSRLTLELRDCVGRDAPILIDQEGGRVARLRPPTWRAAPAAQRFADLWQVDEELAIEATRINHRLLAHELRTIGVDVDCAPVADLRIEGADDIIGDRAFGTTPEPVIHLGRAAMDGLMAGGVAPIIKHIPGHGRARADSHLELPVVPEEHGLLSETDFAPFKGLNDAPMAMTAHIVYSDIDRDLPATQSADMVDKVVRGEIGFDGLLMTDDLSMKALTGTFRERGELSLKAGCDMLLHCNGQMSEMIGVAEGTTALTGRALERAEAAERIRDVIEDFDPDDAESRLNDCLDRLPA
ncbi:MULTISPECIES: beta-N-acetylhexosaminidase [Maricaulis]|uniref:beta-N-acetylhexosaminidase n=1 Tax=Maricaulis maris (strain MCS10) TaxID=394221 RepID=Q0AND3_MARMM|nr:MULTISPECIES: beta-N-acetylhexosaminidase [Maricaulis]ABI66204.1 Beta-N-acetylhexosaminidase [Maricaulis maris MCS10]MAC90471.1 beta-N-acetylhexosaminidase [Maricaulis sp.]